MLKGESLTNIKAFKSLNLKACLLLLSTGRGKILNHFYEDFRGAQGVRVTFLQGKFIF